MTRSPVIEGPRWYRARIRSLGPFAALVPPAVLGLVAMAALALGSGKSSALIGLVGGVIAAPTLLLAGAPFGHGDAYTLAVVASVPLWLLIGFVAARRATRSPMATWREFWHEYAFLAAGVAIGAVAALVAATVILGETLLI